MNNTLIIEMLMLNFSASTIIINHLRRPKKDVHVEICEQQTSSSLPSCYVLQNRIEQKTKARSLTIYTSRLLVLVIYVTVDLIAGHGLLSHAFPHLLNILASVLFHGY